MWCILLFMYEPATVEITGVAEIASMSENVT